SGLKRPGEKLGLSDKGKWAFEPEYDAFDRKDPINLRALNESIAGQSGYIRTNTNGDFVKANGEPIRFWATQGGLHRSGSLDSIRRHARHLAKRGVNMVRHHGHLNPVKGDPMIPDPSEIDATQKLVALMKEQGIYTTLSPYWGPHSNGDQSWKSFQRAAWVWNRSLARNNIIEGRN
ncbi:MAG: hypothetical protein GY786_20705, partial [Proteobacteria bacterium]|nr:hypothetical protein [Pseudomonadota bacterium]